MIIDHKYRHWFPQCPSSRSKFVKPRNKLFVWIIRQQKEKPNMQTIKKRIELPITYSKEMKGRSKDFKLKRKGEEGKEKGAIYQNRTYKPGKPIDNHPTSGSQLPSHLYRGGKKHPQSRKAPEHNTKEKAFKYSSQE